MTKSNKCYIIMKASRIPFDNTPKGRDAYQGITCEQADIEPGQIYDNYQKAQIDADKLSAINPVGFRVWELHERSTT